MTLKKEQQPLLYTHQPNFENQFAPMQQTYLLNNRKKRQNDQVELINFIHIQQEELVNEEKNASVNLENNIDLATDINLSLVDIVEEDPNVMEFLLEGIFSPNIDVEQNEKETIDNIQSVISNNLVQVQGTLINTNDHEVYSVNVMNQECIKERSILNNELSLPKRKIEKKINKRIAFNELILEKKLKQLQKMPADVVKIIFDFITKDITFRGYFLFAKEGTYTILAYNSSELINISEQDIININMVGL